MTTTLRRTALAEPEPLLLSSSPFTAADRLDQWIAYTGIPAGSNVSTPLVAVPLPIYPQSWEPGHRRWSTVTVQAMWHPLLWLPPKLAGRYIIDGETETAELWAVRVAYELTAAGLYDPAAGTWLDVLSTIGINVDEPAAQQRLTRWLAGAADEDLDLLTLDPLLDQVPATAADPDWAVHQACDELDELHIISWATSAEILLDHANDLLDAPDEHRQGAALLAGLAATAFADLPQGQHATSPEAAWWSSVAELAQQEPATAVSDITERLTELRDRYRPMLDTLAARSA